MKFLPLKDAGGGQFLTVGAGFSGSTSTPSAYGSGRGASAKPCVRWMDVPAQSKSGAVAVSLAAFHVNGIDRVEFSANGGPWKTVRKTSRVYTKGGEYATWIDTSGIADGQVEVRAIVYPALAGQPRVMQGTWFASDGSAYPPSDGVNSFWFWANNGGTYTRSPIYVSPSGNDSTGDGSIGSPYLTINKAAQRIKALYTTQDGGSIICRAGTFVFDLQEANTTYGTANYRWVTVEAYSGESVTLTYGRPQQNLLHVKNCTLRCSNGTFYIGFNSGAVHNLLWMDGCTVSMPLGRWDASNSNGTTIASAVGYSTDSTWDDCSHAIVGHYLSRGCVVTRTGEDAVNGSDCVVDLVVDDVDPGATSFHPDLWQYYAPGTVVENRMVYGMKGTNLASQGLHCGNADATSFDNCAFVNVLVEMTSTQQTTHLWAPLNHCLFLNSTWIGQSFLIRSTVDTACAWVGCMFYDMTFSDSGSSSQVEAALTDSNNFVSGTPRGTDYTSATVAASLTNVAGDDFSAKSGGPLQARVDAPQARWDAAGKARGASCAIGAYE